MPLAAPNAAPGMKHQSFYWRVQVHMAMKRESSISYRVDHFSSAIVMFWVSSTLMLLIEETPLTDVSLFTRN
jgi:hypothetical protein